MRRCPRCNKPRLQAVDPHRPKAPKVYVCSNANCHYVGDGMPIRKAA
jgi:uncharacterized protein YbaR (Trm112 family)